MTQTAHNLKSPTAKCKRCGAIPKFVNTMLDSVAGRDVHNFRCVCGELSWLSDPKGRPMTPFLIGAN